MHAHIRIALLTNYILHSTYSGQILGNWHWWEAMKKHIKDPEMLSAVFNLYMCPEVKDFPGLVQTFELNYGATTAGQYFIKNYIKGRVRLPESWARCYNRNFCSHNLYPER